MGLPIFYIDSGKGGVGRSLFSLAAVDYLLESGKKVFLIDADIHSQDLFFAFERDRENVNAAIMDLTSSDGWLKLVEVLEKFADRSIVINSGANVLEGTLKHGRILLESLPELKRVMFVFWILNRHRDSLRKFKELMEKFPSLNIYSVRNMIFGEPQKFSFFNSSEEKKLLEGDGKEKKVFDFPEMADRVAESISNERLSIGNGIKNLSLGERCELKRWRKLCFEVFDGIPGLQQHE